MNFGFFNAKCFEKWSNFKYNTLNTELTYWHRYVL